MGTCPFCGFSRLVLERSKCAVCFRELCERCRIFVGFRQELVYAAPDPSLRIGEPGYPGGCVPEPPVNCYVCSWACFDRWAQSWIAQGQAPVLTGLYYKLASINLDTGAAERAIRLAADYRRRRELELADHLETAGDYEGAAKAYQDLGMWDKAAEVRRKAPHGVVTQVEVNLNQLMDQLREAGISTSYKCPGCGIAIPITGETTASALATCRYCGTPLPRTDLIDFLTKIVE